MIYYNQKIKITDLYQIEINSIRKILKKNKKKSKEMTSKKGYLINQNHLELT